MQHFQPTEADCIMRNKADVKTLGLAFLQRGPVAQLGERLVRNEEASGSIPLRSTNFQ